MGLGRRGSPRGGALLVCICAAALIFPRRGRTHTLHTWPTCERPSGCAWLCVRRVAPPGATLRLRGGDMGPRAQLEPENGDLLVHHVSSDMPRPSHQCLRSALHRTRVKRWSGRRIFVSSSYRLKSKQVLNRYSWEKPIRIGTMKYGSGNASVVRVAGDDKVQIWGQWHYAGQCSGIYQGLFCMHTTYHPYQPLMLAEKYANVLFQQVLHRALPHAHSPTEKARTACRSLTLRLTGDTDVRTVRSPQLRWKVHRGEDVFADHDGVVYGGRLVRVSSTRPS